MNRALLVPFAAATLMAGCVQHSNCTAPDLVVYWDACNATGCKPPQAGFVVPGLVAAGFSPQLDCVEAGVDGVQVFVSNQIVPCPASSQCVDANTWACSTGGLTVPVVGAGTYTVEVLGFDPAGQLKYRSGVDAVGVNGCGATSFGSFSNGLPGPMGLGYSLAALAAPTGTNCATAPGSDGTFLWFQVTAPNGDVDEVGRDSAAPFTETCGTVNPIPLFPATNGQPVSMPAGVYRLDRIEEVVRSPGPPVETRSFRSDCAAQSLVHAGPELLSTQAVTVNVPPATALTCWP